MRIHRLTLQAVGPFPGRHTVDVDALSAGGLFLLEGPTGAGKSTIIDAVVFALYGGVAGGESSDDRLHSDHADPEVEPFVELTFSTAAGIYRVWRSPKFLRPKKRGGGFTTQNARAKLWRLSGADDVGEPVSAQVQEVGGELGRIVVLDRAQFTQTVVLPQGQFASFLRARPEDRRAVLQDVFGTEVYEKLQKQLAEMARTTRTELDRATDDIGAAARAFASAAALEEGPALEDPATLDGDTLTALTGTVCKQVEERADQEDARCTAAAAAERSARSRLDAQRALAEQLRRRSALLVELETLTAAEPGIRSDTERLELARRAATVTGAAGAYERATARVERAQQQHDSLLATVRSGTHTDLAPLDSLALRAACDAATAELGAVTELVTLEAGLPARQERLAADRAGLERALARTAEDQAALELRPAARAKIDDELGGYRDAGARHSGAQADATAANAVLEAARAARERARDVATAETAVAAAAARCAAAADAEHTVRRRWVAGIAGALAGTLQDGRPCAVCGSPEHPAPARPSPEHATDEDVEVATTAREEADRSLGEARTRLTTVTEQLHALRAAAEGLDVEAAQERCMTAAGAVDAAMAAILRSAQLEQDLSDHDAETASLTGRLAAARADQAGLTARLAQQDQQLAADRARCERGRGGSTSVTHRAAELQQRAETAHALLEAAQERTSAAEAADDAAARLTAALTEADLADVAAVRGAILTADDQRVLAERVRRHDNDAARVRAGLGEPAVAALSGDEKADVPGAESAHQQAMAVLADATGAAREHRVRARQVRAAADTLLATLTAHEQRLRQAAPVLRTAALATAGEGNELDTTLATFVLLRRFEDVVAAANDRLSLMSDGRYALERIDEREGGQRSRKAGLGLQVRDHVTESPRDPHTLSGGETFYVSLCLALGLADVVRSEAGGVELGTLFVDEGFGSLDPATLDTVMTELGRLREGGRSVGIVSHVTELKDRIPERIEVRRLPSGASTLAVRS
ncbi:AAA family ATPase [Georgenia subflava]|uniref:Nuclease SbcCD subunit C n=1 Tax=Georgenia subflava TaxID=1622177 RepID=A0A6N7EK59_9MICO|nr:SMC family ATPase [Georgenia subflava]MPV38742.1 AAA family ATPase [Georgenia subflava]